jgi:hypothetical protein
VELEGRFAANRLLRVRVNALKADGALKCEAAHAAVAQ